MTCEERKDLILLYAADALDGNEKVELRHHLASGCAACNAELSLAQKTFNSLSLELQPIDPPPQLKQRLMDRIARSANSAPLAEQPIPDGFAIRLFRLLVPAVVAAGIAVVVTHAVITRQNNQQATSTAQLQAMLSAKDSQIAALAAKIDDQQQTLAMLHSPQLKVVDLAGQAVQPKAAARLMWDQKTQTWLMLATGMSAPPTGQTYELWYITADSRKIRAATFNVDSAGNATIHTSLPADLGPLAAAAVTNEPMGGVDAPTGQIQLLGKL